MINPRDLKPYPRHVTEILDENNPVIFIASIKKFCSVEFLNLDDVSDERELKNKLKLIKTIKNLSSEHIQGYETVIRFPRIEFSYNNIINNNPLNLRDIDVIDTRIKKLDFIFNGKLIKDDFTLLLFNNLGTYFIDEGDINHAFKRYAGFIFTHNYGLDRSRNLTATEVSLNQRNWEARIRDQIQLLGGRFDRYILEEILRGYELDPSQILRSEEFVSTTRSYDFYTVDKSCKDYEGRKHWVKDIHPCMDVGQFYDQCRDYRNTYKQQKYRRTHRISMWDDNYNGTYTKGQRNSKKPLRS